MLMSGLDYCTSEAGGHAGRQWESRHEIEKLSARDSLTRCKTAMLNLAHAHGDSGSGMGGRGLSGKFLCSESLGNLVAELSASW
jgi:hypothetical protein